MHTAFFAYVQNLFPPLRKGGLGGVHSISGPQHCSPLLCYSLNRRLPRAPVFWTAKPRRQYNQPKTMPAIASIFLPLIFLPLFFHQKADQMQSHSVPSVFSCYYFLLHSGKVLRKFQWGRPMPQDKKLAVGVIGAGRIGRLHAENLACQIPQAVLAALAEPNAQASRSLAHRLGVTSVYSSPEPLLENPGVDAVVICTPTDTHADLIEKAAAAGKHIFCEKPIALDLASVDRALQAVRSASVKFQVGFNRRFDASFRRVRSGIEAGEIGQVHLLRIASRDPELPPLDYLKASGGLFLDMTIHDFDMARYLTGAEVQEVYAMGAARIDPQVTQAAGDIDTAIVTLRMAGDIFGAVENSRRAVYGYDQRVEVFGSGGVLSADNATPHQVTLSDAKGLHGPMPYNFFMDRYPQSYQSEMMEFVSCVLEDAEPSATGQDGRAAVVIALAAKRSLVEGRPVRPEEIAGLP